MPGLRKADGDDHQQDRERGNVLAMRLVRRGVERREALGWDRALTGRISLSGWKPAPQIQLVSFGTATAASGTA